MKKKDNQIIKQQKEKNKNKMNIYLFPTAVSDLQLCMIVKKICNQLRHVMFYKLLMHQILVAGDA